SAPPCAGPRGRRGVHPARPALGRPRLTATPWRRERMFSAPLPPSTPHLRDLLGTANLPAMALGANALPAQRSPPLAPGLLFGGAAGGVLALHLATNGTLGFHTDELYYLDCGRHPALGYVDFPPVVPLLARLETGLLGVSPWTLRLLPSLLGALLVALSGAYVRRLGGFLLLPALSLPAALAAPVMLGYHWCC